MKRIMLAVALLGAVSLLSACCNSGGCGAVSTTSCCNTNNCYNGNWY